MKKLLAVLLFFGVSFLSADDEDFSYTYFDLSAVQADNTGYDATFSLGLPFSLYLRGSVEDIDAEIENAIFEKSSSIVTLGTHVSIADLLKNVTKDGTGFIILTINDVDYSPERCYVPQMGEYENLSYIMDDYFPEPVFGPSGLPQYLDENLLQPTIIYGTVFDAKTQNIVPGAEVSIAGTSKWRITDELGKYAFQINEPGSYQVIVNPPFGYPYSQTGITEILVQSGRGGWYHSNHYLNP